MGAATAFGSGAAEVLTAGGATPLVFTTLGLSATMIGDGSNIMLGEYKHSEGANVLASLGRPVNSYAWDGALAVGKTGLEIGTLSLLSRTLPAVDAAVTSGSKVLSKEVAIAGKGVQREAVILEKQVDQDISYTHNHVAGHNRAAAKMEAKQVKNVVKTGEESGKIDKSEVGYANKGLYDAHEIRETLEKRYPGQVLSSTVADLHQKNVRLAGTKHPKSDVVFDTKGFPIFDKYMTYDTKIPGSVAGIKNSKEHMKAATRDLRDSIVRGKVDRNMFSDIQLKQIMAGKDKIKDLTWHHHQDVGRLQLIPEKIHDITGHIGGMKLWFIK